MKFNKGSDKINVFCIRFDNRSDLEIVGYSAGSKKDATLVYEAFMSTNINLTKVNIFHTNRGN